MLTVVAMHSVANAMRSDLPPTDLRAGSTWQLTHAVDTHLHIYDTNVGSYHYSDFLAAAAGTPVAQAVYVECTALPPSAGQSANELSSVIANIERTAPFGGSKVAAMIGALDLESPATVVAELDALRRAAKGTLRGVRLRAAWHPDPHVGYAGRPDFPQYDVFARDEVYAGISSVAAAEMVLEVWAFHSQLAQLMQVASAFPKLRIVLNHLGGPLGVGPYAEAREDMFAEWEAGLVALAGHNNVYLKVSGIGLTRLNLAEDLQNGGAFAERLINRGVGIFGPSRCIYGSNYPVDNCVATYAALIDVYQRSLSFLTNANAHLLFDATAKNLYQLGE